MRQQGFFVAGVLHALRRCMLGIESMDALVMIYKNWLGDPGDGCMLPGGKVTKYFNAKVDLVDAHEEEIKEVGLFEVE